MTGGVWNLPGGVTFSVLKPKSKKINKSKFNFKLRALGNLKLNFLYFFQKILNLFPLKHIGKV